MKSVLRDLINNEADVDELLCFGHQPGLLEVSNIAIFNLTPAFAKRLQRNSIETLNNYRLPSPQEGYHRTSWVISGEGFDKIIRNGKITSRAFYYMARGNVKNSCGEIISKLKNEKALVSFTYPKKWKITDCDDSCRAYLIFPTSKLAVTATFD